MTLYDKLSVAISTKDSNIVSKACKSSSTEKITKDEKLDLLQKAISIKDLHIVNYICKLESTEKITKKQQKELISLAQKSNDVNIINYINNYDFLNPKSKEEEAPYATIPKELNFSDINRDTEPLMVDNKKQKSWIQKLKNLVNSNGVKYQQKQRGSDSKEGYNKLY